MTNCVRKSNFINYYEKRYFTNEGSALAIKYGTRRAKLAGSHDESDLLFDSLRVILIIFPYFSNFCTK